MSVSEVADRLYTLPPSQFTEARNEEAKRAGDAQLASAIRALRKPSTSAHLVNLLVRARSDEVDDLLALGVSMRQAQDALDGEELRALSRQRRQVVGSLTAAAGQVYSGGRVSDPVAREISATLEAALADDGAAAAVRSGRLIKSLASSGFGAVDLDGAVAVPDDLPRLPGGRRLRSVKTPPPGPHARPSPAQRAGQLAADEAADRVAVAERGVVKADAALAAAQADAERARTRVDEAEAALREARSALATAEKARTAAKHQRDASARSRDSARRALRTLLAK